MTAAVMLLAFGYAPLVGAFLWVLDRRDRRDREASRDLLEAVQTLAQRIQAPEVAVAQHVAETAKGPEGLPFVPVFDDEAFQLNREEQLASDS